MRSWCSANVVWCLLWIVMRSRPCSSKVNSKHPRAKEFESLVHGKNLEEMQCGAAGQSSSWSCVRNVPSEEVQKRSKVAYGFQTKKEAGHYRVGDTADFIYDRQIPKMPKLSGTIGFRKMNMTSAVRKVLYPWFRKASKKSGRQGVERERAVPGGFLNNVAYPSDKLNLDEHRDIQSAIAREMQDVMEWWTGAPVDHTATFGIRIYRKDAMLLNHVDRLDTHLASAVLQVHQDIADPSGGWPLELIGPNNKVYEVYLQPGEMVLYEGARVKHGRPMRFKGEGFANIFSHFAPKTWPKKMAKLKARNEL